ncbi:MAG: hypothetical protein AAB152_13910 [Candidatus Coatesbacteria bacterium]
MPMSEDAQKKSWWQKFWNPEPEEEKPRKDMNWSITGKVLAASFVIVTIVVIVLQKLLWPAEEWECRNNIMLLNKAAVKWNKGQLAQGIKTPYDVMTQKGLLVEDLTEPIAAPETPTKGKKAAIPNLGKSYIQAVLVEQAKLVPQDVATRILRKHKNDRNEEEEIHYYYLGEVAHSWDLYYTGLRVTRDLPDGPKAMNVACKCNAHEMNPETIELLGILILTGIASIFTWSFMGYSLPFKDEEEAPVEAPKA